MKKAQTSIQFKIQIKELPNSRFKQLQIRFIMKRSWKIRSSSSLSAETQTILRRRKLCNMITVK